MDEMILITKVRDYCDDIAFNEILILYSRMIQSIISYYVNEVGDYKLNRDDLKQEAYIGLYDACKCYKKDMNTKFSTFAYTCIKRKVHSFYIKYTNLYYKEGISLDNHKIKESSFLYENKKEQSDYLYKKEILNKLMTTLSDEDRKIINLRINNYSYKEISNILKIKEKRVDNRLMFIKDKLSKSKLVLKDKIYS